MQKKPCDFIKNSKSYKARTVGGVGGGGGRALENNKILEN